MKHSKDDCDRIKSESSKKEDELLLLRNKLSAINQEFDSKTKTFSNLDVEYYQLELKLSEGKAKLEHLNNQLKEKISENDKLKEDESEMDERIENLSKDLTDIYAKINHNQTKKRMQENQILAIENNLKHANDECDHYHRY